jgi:hypothetical protein
VLRDICSYIAGGRGLRGLIAVRFLPPAGLSHIEAEALGTLDGGAFLLTRSMR